jgi:GNAT superfamily N-acetyltransferase
MRRSRRVTASGVLCSETEVLAEAFNQDPVWQWVFPDPASRLARLNRFFGLLIRYDYAPYGVVDAVIEDKRIKAVALWIRPERAEPALRRKLLYLPRFLPLLGLRSAVVLRRSIVLDNARPGARHWYLGFLATAPQYQGTGYATSLLMQRLTQCDKSRTLTYLEASRQSTQSFYMRFGFDPLPPIQWPADGPPVWPMIRKPR